MICVSFYRYVICTGLRTNGKEVHDYLYYINETIGTLQSDMDILQVNFFEDICLIVAA